MSERGRDEEILGGVIFIIVILVIALLIMSFLFTGCSRTQTKSGHSDDTELVINRHVSIQATECEELDIDILSAAQQGANTNVETKGDKLTIAPSKLKKLGGVKP